MKNTSILYVFLVLFSTTFKAFSGEIKGIIINKDKAISFASIVILNSKIGTQTDENGKFIIKNAPIGKQTIQFSSI
jgi:outer membrane receptor for ferrienterochelin and colicins